MPLVFAVTNTSKVELELQLLGRSPTADFRVFDSRGLMIWSRLGGETLLGPLRLYPLAAGKNLSFREIWDQRTDEGAKAPRATYTVVAVLLTDEPDGLPSAPARISIE
ncbi:MAG TPA: hypothetical protein VJU17_02520 [Gemmatimonadales bacterium]|nr:hypothetical protein [Gemmatimonadales bacterium]